MSDQPSFYWPFDVEVDGHKEVIFISSPTESEARYRLKYLLKEILPKGNFRISRMPSRAVDEDMPA